MDDTYRIGSEAVPASDYLPPKMWVALRLRITGELSVPGGSSPTTM